MQKYITQPFVYSMALSHILNIYIDYVYIFIFTYVYIYIHTYTLGFSCKKVLY